MWRKTAGVAIAGLLAGSAPLFAQAPASPPAQNQEQNDKPANAPTIPAAPPPASAGPLAPSGPSSVESAQRREPFGQETTLVARTIVFKRGASTWDRAFETLLEAFKAISAYIKRENLQTDGSAIVIYTATEDTGFQFQAAIPISGEPKAAPSGDIGIGKSPSGQALKFVHEGPYDAMDTTYELITNYLDEKRLESKELFIEEYVTDPLTTAEDKLIINVLVPLK